MQHAFEASKLKSVLASRRRCGLRQFFCHLQVFLQGWQSLRGEFLYIGVAKFRGRPKFRNVFLVVFHHILSVLAIECLAAKL